MKILSNYKQYNQAIKEIDPQRIAVAYIGTDYTKFINTKNLKEIIISPTIGSNPYAISSLIKSIGLSNVHFIDNLHSKLYIGKSGAIIGSANLSHNALDAKGLIELGIFFQTPKDLEVVRKLFVEYKKLAKTLYPSPSFKEKRIAKLYVSHHKWIRFSIGNGGAPPPRKYFDKYEWGIDEQFKLSWYDVQEDDESAYVKKQFYKEFPGATWKEIYGNISADMEIPKGDRLNEGEWLLTFFVNDKSQCMKTGLEWMFIDKKIKNAYTKGYFPDCCLQLNIVKHSAPPFIIDKKFRKIFVDVINQVKYKTIRETNYIKNITPSIPKILKEIKNRY